MTRSIALSLSATAELLVQIINTQLINLCWYT